MTALSPLALVVAVAVMQLAIPNTPGVADVWRLHWEAELVQLNEDMEVQESSQDTRAHIQREKEREEREMYMYI